jgi:hypothetical protein
VSGKDFIDRIIDNLENHVVQACTVIGITNVHAWALSYCIQPF